MQTYSLVRYPGGICVCAKERRTQRVLSESGRDPLGTWEKLFVDLSEGGAGGVWANAVVCQAVGRIFAFHWDTLCKAV